MQETEFHDKEGAKRLREFFTGQTDPVVIAKMNDRLMELEPMGHRLVKRVKIGRNEICPCGSGKKFKQCCIDKVRE